MCYLSFKFTVNAGEVYGFNNDNYNKKLTYCRGTARRTMSLEMLSAAAQMYKKF